MAKHIEDRYARKQEGKDRLKKLKNNLKKGAKRAWVEEDDDGNLKSITYRKSTVRDKRIKKKRDVKKMRNINLEEFMYD
jgi:hypothetical protein